MLFERSGDGYGAYVPDLPGCVTVGDTLGEARNNIQEAISGHLATMMAHNETVLQPTTLVEYIEICGAAV